MMNRADLFRRPPLAASVAAILLIATTLLAGCDARPVGRPDMEAMSQASSLPDLSGLAWIEGDRFLTVHDAKNPDENDLPRVSMLELPSGLDGILWQPQEVDLPGGPSNDFESVARVPGTNQVLLVESTEEQDEKPFSRRIFLARVRLFGVDIMDVLEWPVETHNVEGSAIARVGEKMLFLYAERAEGEGGTEIHFAEFQAGPLGMGTFTSAGTFTSPGPTGKDARPVSGIEVDSSGVVYVASAYDTGDDNGPFRSAVYAIGQAVEEGGGAKVVLYKKPQQLAVLDGLKVESLAVREQPGKDLELFVGLDDENYGGTMRPLPLLAVDTSSPPAGMSNPASKYCVNQGGKLEIRTEAGGEVGYCLLPDGSECEEWAFFRGGCAPGGGYYPLEPGACAEVAGAVTEALGVTIDADTVPFEDSVSGETGTGCRATATGTGADFESLPAVATALKTMLQVRGWDEDVQYAADGPMGTAATFRQANALCLLQVGWEPSEDADCPSDQPISACVLTPEQQLYTITINCAQRASPAGTPNPASQHCVDEGGKLEIRTEAGGEVGYCLFPDGSECEEWAFFRDECAPGSSSSEQETGRITARMLVEPDALVGPGPSHLNWSPLRATLAYVAPGDSGDVLWLYDATTGDKRVLLDPADHAENVNITSAQWSPEGDSLLLTGENALWLLDVESGELASLAEGGGRTALAFSPSGEAVSYVQNNDLYTIRISDASTSSGQGGQIQRLTTDGGETVFNGTLDWVYTEEFATRVAQPAYAWSPDGRWLVYLRLDDDQVQQHPVTDFRTIPPSVSYTRYPTAGSPNPAASLHVVDVESGGRARSIPLPDDAEYIMPFFTWSPDSGEAFYLVENRDHTVLDLRAWDPSAGTGRTVIRETDPHWVNELLYVSPMFLGDGERFLWLSERDGFMHLYLYARDGTLVRQLTQGEWLIDTLPWDLLTPGRPVHIPIPGMPVHTDPTGGWAYFSTTQTSPLERQLYRLNLESGEMEQLTQEPGFHLASISSDGEYLVEHFSNVETPPVTSILRADGSLVEVLAERSGPSLDLPAVSREFVTIKAHDDVDLYGQIVKPEGFDPAKKYPVIVHWYGGPTLQLVSNRYGTDNVFNHIERDVVYTQEGFIVWRLDNRGSFGRGHAFETPIAKHLGPAALDDQLAGVEYLRSLPYVDADRIGADGKSFGGFLTLYALIHEPDVFRAGVAGSGPTDWRYYDTVYTERYMGTPDENQAGYEATELISRVDQIQVRPLIIHGLADTNVHLQNSVNLMGAMMAIDKPFDFLPLPNSDHHYGGDGLVSVLSEGAEYFVRHLGEP